MADTDDDDDVLRRLRTQASDPSSSLVLPRRPPTPDPPPADTPQLPLPARQDPSTYGPAWNASAMSTALAGATPRRPGAPAVTSPPAALTAEAAGASSPAQPLAGAPPRRELPQPPKPQYRDPLEVLGNPLTALALIASAFVQNSAGTAIGALAAAMTAQAKGDQQAYADAYREYEQQLKKVQGEIDEENAEYDRIFQNRKLSLQERLAKMRGYATRRGDHVMLGGLDSGGEGWVIDRRKHASGKLKAGQTKAQWMDNWLAEPENQGKSRPEADAEYDRRKKAAAGGDGGKGGEGAYGDTTLEGEEYLNSIPSEFRDRVRAVASGDAAVPVGKWGQRIAASAFHLNPALRQQAYGGRAAAERYFAGGAGTASQITLNQMMGHMANALRSGRKLGLGAWRTANKALGAWGRETNDPDWARFEIDLDVLREEAANVFKGNRATEGEIKRKIAEMPDSDSWVVLATKLQELSSLLESRLQGQAEVMARGTGQDPRNINLLGPHAKAAREEVEAAGREVQGAGAAQGPQGSKHIGWTPEGKEIFEMPDGSRVTEQ